MRILFADQFSEFGGAQIALCDLLDETVRRGWQAEVLAPGNGPLHAACAARGIPAWPLPLGVYSNDHKSFRDVLRYPNDTMRCGLAIRGAARKSGADLIYVNGPRVLLAATLAAESENTPVIFHLHSHLDREYARRIARWCVARGHVSVLAISGFVARPFAAMAGSRRVRVIYNGVADRGFLQRPRRGPGCIGILGRISPEKGHLDFVRAAITMAGHRPGLRFVVFGTSMFSDDSYEREVRAAAAGTPVEWHGWTGDVSAALHEIDVLAVPSGPGEGATRVVMEAFSAGTPVVAYPSGGIPELVRQVDTGLLTTARGHDALAEALIRLLNNPGLMEQFSVRGRREWEARFRLERCQREICNFMEETLMSPLPVWNGGQSATSAIRSARPAPEPADDAGRAAP